MRLKAMTNRVLTHLGNSKRVPPLTPPRVVLALNDAHEEICVETGILSIRRRFTTTSGVINLGSASPDDEEAPLGGIIQRVEDAGNGNRVLSRVTEEDLDNYVGDQWRAATTGIPQYWLRGRASGTQTGYQTVLIYPLINARQIDIYFQRRPAKLENDDDEPGTTGHPGLPVQHHSALVWHAIMVLAGESKDEADKQVAGFARERYDAALKRVLAEVGSL